MRQITAHLFLLATVLGILALVPVYPASTTDYMGWFGPPGNNFRYVNGTTVHPAIEVLGGGFDWTTTSGHCVTDAGGWVHFQASPVFFLAYGLVAFLLWTALISSLSRPGSGKVRAAILGLVATVLVLAASAWISWYGLLYLSCPADFGPPLVLATGLAAACLAAGAGVLILRARLAGVAWRGLVARTPRLP